MSSTTKEKSVVLDRRSDRIAPPRVVLKNAHAELEQAKWPNGACTSVATNASPGKANDRSAVTSIKQ